MNKIFRYLTLMVAVAVVLPAFGHTPAPRVFLNPGHGGHDSNDRPCPFYNYGVNDTVEYFESNSNLTKGMALKSILESQDYDVSMSRVTNTTADDLDLFEIVALAHNSGADLFFAIHSNATGIEKKVNFPLALYRGFTGEPTVPGNDVIAAAMMRRLENNGATVWTNSSYSAGDWTFYDWGYKVGLGVLRYNKLPGMLCEGSFHDYVPERCRLLNDDYCWLEAWNQSLAINDYFGLTPRVQTGVVAGTLRHADKPSPYPAPLFGADTLAAVNNMNVTLLNDRGEVVATTTTDWLSNGFYLFKDVAPGKYIVQVQYVIKPPKVNLGPGEPVMREIVREMVLTEEVVVEPATSKYANFTLIGAD